jgi:hypothetical protein
MKKNAYIVEKWVNEDEWEFFAASTSKAKAISLVKSESKNDYDEFKLTKVTVNSKFKPVLLNWYNNFRGCTK